MEWRYNCLQWKYYHCTDKQVNKYCDLFQRELDKVFARKELHQVNRNKRRIQVIVALSSIPERLSYVHYPIRCMLRQTVRPDKIVLYLDKDRLDDRKIPTELLQLKENGLDIVYVEDLGPHTKYFYALQTYGDSYVITIDDDIIYDRFLIKDLLRTEGLYKGAVCARRARTIKFTQQGIPYPYSSYMELKGKQSHKGNDLLALGVGGVLYPPNCLNPADFDQNSLQELAFHADDIWLKAMELLKGIEVVRAGGTGYRDINIPGTQEVALCKRNYGYGNDKTIKELFEHYDLFHFFTNSNWEIDTGRDTIARRILTEWLSLYQKELSIGDFLIKRGIHTVAIYGMAKLGIMLCSELEKKGIEVKYGIDVRELNNVVLPSVRPEDISEPVDLIIVTAITDFFKLKTYLEQYTDCEIEMLENIIAELHWENI